jgi:lysophospholipase L1-like esterase
MRRLVSPGLVLAALLALNLVGAPACNKSTKPSGQNAVIAFGDSLFYGIGATAGNDVVSVLSQRLAVNIINASFPGDTTAAALARIKSSVLDRDPRLVMVLLGGNDLLQGVPLQQRISNITNIVTQIRAKGATVILVGISTGNVIDPYEGALPGIASQTGSTLVNGILDGFYGDASLMSADGIHPNNAGYKIMADRLEPTLRAALAAAMQAQ